MFVYFQDLGEMANSDVQSFMKNRIDWRSQSVENWLRHNFEETDSRHSGDDGKSENISKNSQMDQLKKRYNATHFWIPTFLYCCKENGPCKGDIR